MMRQKQQARIGTHYIHEMGAAVAMSLALTCVRFGVLGGRERDCLEIASELGALGHDVTLLTTSPPSAEFLTALKSPIDVEVIRQSRLSNHAGVKAFANAVSKWRQAHQVNAVIGFNRMAGLDFLYAVDRPWPSKKGVMAMLPRNRIYMELERAVFGKGQSTYIFFLAACQAEQYRQRYDLAPDRYQVLKPILRAGRMAHSEFYQPRARLREELNIPQDHTLLINVAIYGARKGTDRVVEALASVPDATLVLVGLKDARNIQNLVSRLGVSDRVRILGHREDLDQLIGAADLMVHPAREEAAGNVIIESLLYGVPVIANSLCGYSEHICMSGAGQVLPDPFRMDDMLEALGHCREPSKLQDMRLKAQEYSGHLLRSFSITDTAHSILQTVANRLSERYQGIGIG